MESSFLQQQPMLCGVDEAGRGPLAGPVYAAAVILDAARPIMGLADSKTLSAARLEQLAVLIKAQALHWAVAFASVAEIDRLNILQATLLAMQRAVAALTVRPDEILVDGNRLPKFDIAARAIVRGDITVAAISAASILAKTSRDAEMLRLHQLVPHYGFDRHKGYGTAAHLAALTQHGASMYHRRSFAPVQKVMIPSLC